jgi:hypothetical protein
MQEEFVKRAVRQMAYELQYILIDIAYVVRDTIVLTVSEIVKAMMY